MSFDENLAKLRKEHNLSQRKLAEELGTSHSLISQYESGARKPSFEMLCEIADYFNVIIESLVGETTEDPQISRLLAAWNRADPVYQNIAIELLENHPKE